MDTYNVALLLACVVAVTAFAPFEDFLLPKPYSFGYAIKDKHGEQHRQEVGDGLHSVKGSYGFKDERGIERQVNYVADKGGFRAEVKTNEPGTAPLNPAAVKMESSAHPYFGTSKGPVAAGVAKEGLALASGFGFPGIWQLDAAKLTKNALAFDAEVMKEKEKDLLSSELAKEGLTFGAEYDIAKEGYPFAPIFDGGLAKEAEAEKEAELEKEGLALAKALGSEELAKLGLIYSPLLAKESAAFNLKEAELEKEGLAFATALGPEKLAKLGLIYSPSLAKESSAFKLKEAELEKEGLAFAKLKEALPFAPAFSKATPPFLAPIVPKPKGFAYGGPLLGGFVQGYDARFY